MNKLRRKYVTSRLSGFHLFIAVCSGCLYLAGRFTRETLFLHCGYLLFAAGIFSWLIHLNQYRLNRYLTIHKNTSHLPIHQIRRMNRLFLTGFLALTGGVLYLFPQIPYQGILSVIAGGLKQLFAKILGFIFRDVAKSGNGKTLSPEYNHVDLSNVHRIHTPAWAEILDALMQIVAVVVVLAVVLLFLYIVYQKLSGIQRKENADEAAFTEPEIVHEKLRRNRREKKLSIFSRTPGERIRKVYVREITRRRKKKEALPASATPTELERYIRLPQTPAAEALHFYYEKARYSREGCTADDWKIVKKDW